MSAPVWMCGSKAVRLDGPRIVGILNVTPDSFSDGGEIPDARAAVDAAVRMVADGADALDVGGESTRPGASRVPGPDQISRVVPAISALRAALPQIVITVDTTRAAVARAALDAGADGVNDVSAGTDDPAMLPLCAERGAGLVLMHRLTDPASDRYSHAYPREPDYGPGGVAAAVREFLAARAEAAARAGVAPDRLALDPGLGFGKSIAQNLELIARTGELAALGLPVMSALSRKSFTARAAGIPMDAPPRDRVHAGVGLSVLHLAAGARLFRVHDVAPHADALRAAWTALTTASP